MSDAAFATAPFPAMTTDALRARVAEVDDMNFPTAEVVTRRNVMFGEIERRGKRDAGDVSVMTAGERLRHARKAAR